MRSTLPDVSARGPRRSPTGLISRASGATAAGGGGGARALGGRVRGRGRPAAASWPSARAGCCAALGEHAELDLGGDSRRAAAARHRRRHRAPAADRDRLAPPALRDWAGGFWLPGMRSRPVAGRVAGGGRGRGRVRRADRAFGLGDPRHLRPLQTDAGPVLWPIDRADDRAGLERATGYPARARLPQLPRATARHHRVWATTVRSTTTRRRGRAGRGTRARISSPGCASASPAAGSACARWTPSCSVTGGTRASVARCRDRSGRAPGSRADHARRRARAPRAGRLRPATSGSAAGARAVTCGPGAPRAWPTSPGRRGRAELPGAGAGQAAERAGAP